MKRMVIALLVISLLAPLGLAQGADYPLEGSSVDVHVTPPEGYVAVPEMAMEGEYYFVPAATDDPVRFIYYTIGAGDPRALAEAALKSYATFYDEFTPGRIREESLAELTCLRFDYTCAYPDRSGEHMVYEQTAVAYVPLEGGQFIACIVSLAFDDPSGYREDLTDLMTLALNAIELKC